MDTIKSNFIPERVYDSISAATVGSLAVELNNLKHKDIKIVFIERNLPHHNIDVLYSYEYEKKIPQSIKNKVEGNICA